MMVLCKGTNTEIKFDSCDFHTLVIENKSLLRSITYSFYSDDPDEHFVFSKKYEPFEFNKKGLYIPSAVSLDINNKKILSKINSYLECLLTDELYEEFYEVKSKLSLLAEKLVRQSDFAIDCDYDIGPKDIVKLFGVALTRGDDSFAEALVRYIQLAKEYLGVSLIVISDLHGFFGREELDLIFETLSLSEINILCIESSQPSECSEYEKLHIIDSELCEI